jgi:hypothetical protein
MKQTRLFFKGLNTLQCRISLFCLMYLYVTKFRCFNDWNVQTTTRVVRGDGRGSALLEFEFPISPVPFLSNAAFNVHGSVHRSNIAIYAQKDATLHSLFYLETAVHVSGGTSTHHQERKQLYLQHLVFVTPLLLPAAIVEELELV